MSMKDMLREMTLSKIVSRIKEALGQDDDSHGDSIDPSKIPYKDIDKLMNTAVAVNTPATFKTGDVLVWKSEELYKLVPFKYPQLNDIVIVTQVLATPIPFVEKDDDVSSHFHGTLLDIQVLVLDEDNDVRAYLMPSWAFRIATPEEIQKARNTRTVEPCKGCGQYHTAGDTPTMFAFRESDVPTLLNTDIGRELIELDLDTIPERHRNDFQRIQETLKAISGRTRKH